jgi:hypothetical protein
MADGEEKPGSGGVESVIGDWELGSGDCVWRGE